MDYVVQPPIRLRQKVQQLCGAVAPELVNRALEYHPDNAAVTELSCNMIHGGSINLIQPYCHHNQVPSVSLGVTRMVYRLSPRVKSISDPRGAPCIIIDTRAAITSASALRFSRATWGFFPWRNM